MGSMVSHPVDGGTVMMKQRYYGYSYWVSGGRIKRTRFKVYKKKRSKDLKERTKVKEEVRPTVSLSPNSVANQTYQRSDGKNGEHGQSSRGWGNGDDEAETINGNSWWTSESMATGVDDVGGCSEGIDGDYVGPEEINERDVRPRGYDYQFWEPLIAGDLGGSNAVEVIFNDKDDPCLVKMEAARRAHSSDGKNGEHGQSSRGWGNGDDEAEVPMETYARVISPIGDPRDEDVAEEVRNKVLMPPVTKRPAGRRKTKHFLSIGEIPGPNKKAIPNRCGRCRETGHNRTNCTVPLK
ncbi:hypothetical protein F2Q69_00011720 [Brassica cretica]|uniref:Uncharacterized protein n=1 Tax=Brassica cretica TaxID=69181 RepID=A0A8S9QZ92_BRACR|nr:hypothetical protein F2Q69_00011720 [Brassica cretica]